MASGMRCAETTSAAKATPNSCSARPAALMTGQSESEPITIPTRGCGTASGTGISHQVRRGMPRPFPCFVKIISEGGDMPHLATGAYLLAVQLHPEPPITGKTMQQRRRKVLKPPAEYIGHQDPPPLAAGVAKRKIQRRTQMVLKLRGMGAIDRPVTGVVRPHGQLVDHYRSIGALHELNRKHSYYPELVSDHQRQLLG